MRLFVYEYTCGGGLAGVAGSDSLRAEGWAMLAALLEDICRVPGVSVATILEAERDVCAAVRCRRVDPGEEGAAFREEARAADLTLVIAPETDGILLERHRWVMETGGRWLGSSAEAIALTGDKLALAEHMLRCDVPTPECLPLPARSARFPAVLKPRCGAGSQATYLLRSAEELATAEKLARLEGFGGEWIVQSFVPGQASSVAFLVGPGGAVPLAPMEQRLSTDGRFHYLGGKVPLPKGQARRAVDLGRRAVEAVAGLSGYVGVDLVLGTEASADRVIEINPRLTTSYVGLRALAEDNLAEALLRVARGESVAALRWREGVVSFDTSGAVNLACASDSDGSTPFLSPPRRG